MSSTLGKNGTLTKLSLNYSGLSEEGKATLKQAAAHRPQPLELVV